MNLQSIIIERVQARTRSELIRALGYRGHARQAQARLNAVLNDPKQECALSQSYFDLRHTSRSFVEALCRVLGIPDEIWQPEVVAITNRLHREATAYPAWIFVETGFRRANHPYTPIFVLAVMESQRRLRLPVPLRLRPLSEQLAEVADIVRQHYRKNAGQLPLWGTIQYYRFYPTEKDYYDLTPEGVLRTDTLAAPTPIGASLSIKGRPLSISATNADPNETER